MHEINVMKDVEGFFTEDQINRIVGAAKTPRDRVLIKLGFRSARRISELLLVKKRDIDFDRGLIKYKILKKKKETFKLKPVDSDMLNDLKAYCQNIKAEGYLFESSYLPGHHITRRQAYNIVRNTAKAAGILNAGLKPPHPHVLRHSLAVHIIRHSPNATVGLKIVQMVLEHTSLGSTTSYLQFNQQEEKKELDRMFSKKGDEIHGIN